MQASVQPYPLKRRGGGGIPSTACEGDEESHFGRLEKRPSTLSTLCAYTCTQLCNLHSHFAPNRIPHSIMGEKGLIVRRRVPQLSVSGCEYESSVEAGGRRAMLGWHCNCVCVPVEQVYSVYTAIFQCKLPKPTTLSHLQWLRSSRLLMRSSRVVRASGCQCQSQRQMKQCWITYKKTKKLLLTYKDQFRKHSLSKSNPKYIKFIQVKKQNKI